LTGSLTNFSGEPREEGPTDARRENRGELVELRGERGGTLPAGNIEGNDPLMLAFVAVALLEMFMDPPTWESSINDFTYRHNQGKRHFPEHLANILMVTIFSYLWFYYNF
jgi:hypothetical protein